MARRAQRTATTGDNKIKERGQKILLGREEEEGNRKKTDGIHRGRKR